MIRPATPAPITTIDSDRGSRAKAAVRVDMMGYSFERAQAVTLALFVTSNAELYGERTLSGYQEYPGPESQRW